MKCKSASQNSSSTLAELAKLHQEMRALRSAVKKTQKQCMEQWRSYIHLRSFQASATNLAAYIGLRRHDVRHLQARLASLGLSSLGRCEAHVLATLDSVLHLLKVMAGGALEAETLALTSAAMKDISCVLNHHTNRLLGPPPAHRWSRIMVTLPGEAASDYLFVRELVLRGMDCARINCAHDNLAAWLRMVQFVRQAKQETGRACKILMDLAGPKLRTGPVIPGPAVIHIKPKRDKEGNVIQPACAVLDGSGRAGQPAERDGLGRRMQARIGVGAEWQAGLKAGDVVHFSDLRGKPRKMLVQERLSQHEIRVLCDEGAYLTPDLELVHGHLDKHPARTRVGPIDAPPQPIMLQKDDALHLTREPIPGEPAQEDEDGRTISSAHISCAQPEIFASLLPGQRVWIDDGHIGALVESVSDEGALLRITHARTDGEKLNPGKGLNFPDSDLKLPALTGKDLADLDFVAVHADMVGYSFVQSAENMEQLIAALAERDGKKLGIVAKIETRKALQNLPEIIIRGAGQHPFGVMIARGDLAMEIGRERLAEIQEEILWLCEAAHVPVIWATQVLEGLVKQNSPSRAEFTDAAMAERAECVMLNKGPFVLDAIAALDNVVERMQGHQHKKTAQLRALHW